MLKYDVENMQLIIMSMTRIGYKTEVVFWGNGNQYRWLTGSKNNPILAKEIGDTVIVNFNIILSIDELNYLKIDKVFLIS